VELNIVVSYQLSASSQTSFPDGLHVAEDEGDPVVYICFGGRKTAGKENRGVGGLPTRQRQDYRSNTGYASPAQLRCKIAAGSSVRRRYETHCRFYAAGCLDFGGGDTGSSSTHQSSRKCAPVPEGGQEAAKDVEEGKQETAESNEEIREGATEGDQEGEPSL
jgi:putative component of membrane protein insertase Oxa1/YidC/SpoIIIJ protein YidD